MARAKKDAELRLSGTRLGTRFSLLMTIALTLVMLGAGAFLYNRTLLFAQEVQEEAFVDAVETQGPDQARFLKVYRDDALGLSVKEEDRLKDAEQVRGTEEKQFAEGLVVRKEVLYGPNRSRHGYQYMYRDIRPPLIVPTEMKGHVGQGLLWLILGVTLCVILVGALVAWMIGNAVSQPLEMIVDDIAQISRGDLRHRTRVRAGGEIMLLAKSIDRMAGNLEVAQAAQLELSVREREIGLASEVREALLPESTPEIRGYELGALHVDSPTPGGAFHDFIQLENGNVGLLVGDVSGRGIPGAMIGAIARSYLRMELGREQDLSRALSRVNREIARDVRRGMFATALYALVDPREGIATVACAGHKLPLIRFSAADGKIRLVHPEGIALGFDKGPVFDRALQVHKVPLEPGDRIVIATTGPVQVRNKAGEELGEKGFYRIVLQHAGQPTAAMLDDLKRALERFATGEAFPDDISIITLARKA
jgi:serine phosphatase RsbU (regulator of sigma subunit)